MMGMYNEQGSSLVESAIAFVILITITAPLFALLVENPILTSTKQRGRACLFAAEVLEMDDVDGAAIERGQMVARVERVESDATELVAATVELGTVECRLEVVRLGSG